MAIEIDIQKKLGDFRLCIDAKSSSRRIGILGASGCGKSLALKCIAGIERPDGGRIAVDGNIFYDQKKRICLKPQKRRVGYLFQNYALFPTMTINANIAAGLKGTKAQKAQRVEEMIKKFHLEGLGGRLPGELSGGQQQRAALARIMAYGPEVILLDEPYSALDVFLRDKMQQEMQEMLKDYGGLAILVSHSRDEIYEFSEELLVMEKGRIICQGRTEEIFKNPVWKEAAKLTGCKNIARIKRNGAHSFEVPDWGAKMEFSARVPEKAQYIGVRAHDFVPVWGNIEKNCIPVKVRGITELLFERKYILNGVDGCEDGICWFVQRDFLHIIEEKGLPDYLRIPEEKALILQ